MGAILLLITIGGAIAAAVLLAVAFYRKKSRLTRFVSGCVALWFAFYLIAFFAGSLSSREKTLAFNEPKEFCGFYLECHLSASVTGVRRSKTFGSLKARHEFTIVRVRAANGAARAELKLTGPKLTVVDAAGRRFEASEDLTVTVETPKLEEEIPPGGFIEEEFAFDLPPDSANPCLDIREGDGFNQAIEAILIGDEDGFLHKRTFFALTEQAPSAGVN